MTPRLRPTVASWSHPVDTGINPYHEFFAVEESSVTADVLDEFRTALPAGSTLRTITLGEGYLADVSAGKYDDVAAGDLAWFAGTNIIARSAITVDGRPAPDGPRPFLPDAPGDTHGTGVTGSVVTGNPEAVIYFVEGTANEYEAFTHPAVDIITTSYGFATAAPLPLEGFHEGVVELGKLHAGATTNDPSLAPMDGTGGPWWVLGVAGFEEGTSEGKQVLSGTLPDVVADFTQDLPYCDVCTEGTESVGGTSFATPLTAGVASKVLLEARRAAGHLGGITANQDGASYTVLDIVKMGRASHTGLFSIPSRADTLLAKVVLRDMGIESLQDRPYTQLSGGESQLVLIARALVQQTPIIIMDEPTVHLDFRHELKILETMVRLVRKNGITVLMATHFPNHALYFQNNGVRTTVAMLSEKKFLDVGTPDEVVSSDHLSKLYGVETCVVNYPCGNGMHKQVIPISTLD